MTPAEHITTEMPKLDANEIWEFLFKRTKDAVPEEMTNEVLADLAAHINKLWIDPLTELQHRREAEAAAADQNAMKAAALAFYGEHGITAMSGAIPPQFERAIVAYAAASPSSPAFEVKALEWRNYRNDGSLSARTEFGLLYTVSATAWGTTRDFPAANQADGIEAAKAAAQADYEARILSALGEQP